MQQACTGKQRSAEESECSEEAKGRGFQSGLPLGEACEGDLSGFPRSDVKLCA